MAKHSHLVGLHEYKQMINALTIEDVIWIPYVDHQVHQEFDDTTLFWVICDEGVLWLDIYLRGVCASLSMFRASLD